MRTPLLLQRAATALLLLIPFTTIHALEGFDPHGSGDLYPPRANGGVTDKPSLRAHRISQAMTIDGHLTESEWLAAEAGTGFTQFEPSRLDTPCEDTVVKVLYDDDAIYFGVACFRSGGSEIISTLSRRDNINNSDRIRIYIDPYHDLTTGYHFRINPDGVIEDYYNYGDNYHDSSWNAVWEAETFIDEEGWYAEVRIPFSSIRYRSAESMTWGFNVFQYIRSRGQRTAWSNWDRDQSGFMSRSGTLTGLEGIRPPRQLEITPFLAGSMTDPSDPSAHGIYHETWHARSSLGADLKYGLTADLTLNATLQPDFGQVEADPSVVNFSPYETTYEEKRPFFVEGAQFFWHPDFMVFYSRRIGSDSDYSRIRAAGKITGKVAGDLSTALLVAVTDETEPGMLADPFTAGNRRATYAIGRFGKQFAGGNHSFNVMQTAVIRDDHSYDGPTRDGFVTGADFEMNFRDRSWRWNGSFVGSIVDPGVRADSDTTTVDPGPVYGTGWRTSIGKMAGDWRSSLAFRFHHDKLDLNDIGSFTQPDQFATQVVLTRHINSDDGDRGLINGGNLSLSVYHRWLWAYRTAFSLLDPAEVVWSYDRWHRNAVCWTNFNGFFEFSNFWSTWFGMFYNAEGTNRDKSRWLPDGSGPGPLMTEPETIGGWWGFSTDYRKDLSLEYNIEWNSDAGGSRGWNTNAHLAWTQNTRLGHTLSLRYDKMHYDSMWIGDGRGRNVEVDDPDVGIGGVQYRFAELDNRTWRATLRSSMLFNRDQSLELYLEPFLTVGNYWGGMELAEPDTYRFTPLPDLDVSARDFSFGSVNLNMVYRWEYNPGSTLYLVWAHSRESAQRRSWYASDSGQFDNSFNSRPLLNNEPQNRFMAKVSYWLSV